MIKAELNQIKKLVIEVFNVKDNDLTSKCRKRQIIEARAAFAILATNYGYYQHQIVEALNNVIRRSSISHAISTYEDIKLPQFKNKIDYCNQRLGYGFDENYYLSMGKL